jgi:biotin carboxylase
VPAHCQANAEYIRMADEFVKVPGGANNNNYANIMLITETAERTNCDVRAARRWWPDPCAQAVWAGWGHASENPKLPEALSKSPRKVRSHRGSDATAFQAAGWLVGHLDWSPAVGHARAWSGTRPRPRVGT